MRARAQARGGPRAWAARAAPEVMVQGMQRKTASPRWNSATESAGASVASWTPSAHVKTRVESTPHTIARAFPSARRASLVRSLSPEMKKMPAAIGAGG